MREVADMIAHMMRRWRSPRSFCHSVARMLFRCGILDDQARLSLAGGGAVFVPLSGVLFAIGRLRPKSALAPWHELMCELGSTCIPAVKARMAAVTDDGVRRTDLSSLIGTRVHARLRVKGTSVGGWRNRMLHSGLILTALLISGKATNFISSGRAYTAHAIMEEAGVELTMKLTSTGIESL